MDKMRDKFVEEIARLETAIKKTKSNTLRIDYGKKIKRMKNELKQYDYFKQQA